MIVCFTMKLREVVQTVINFSHFIDKCVSSSTIRYHIHIALIGKCSIPGFTTDIVLFAREREVD